MIRYITAYRNNFGKCQQFSVKIMVTDFVNQGSHPHSPIDIDIIDNLIVTNGYSTYSVRDFWQGQLPIGYSWFTRKLSNLYQQIISIDGEPIYTGSHALRLFADNIRYGIFLNPVEENSISPTSITYLFTNSNAGYLPTGGSYYSSDEDGYYLAGSSLEINNMGLDTKVVIMSYLHESVRYAAVFWRDEASGVWRCPTTYSDFNITDNPEFSEYVPEEPYKPGGTVTIILYKNNSEKNVIGKSLTLVRTLKGTFKQEVDISNLSIQVDLEFPNFNYIRVPSFKRYYFVDSVVNIRDNLWEIKYHLCEI